MTTARDLINDALKDAGAIGVGQTALAEDINDGLKRLNAMMAQWSRQRWLVYHLIDVAFVADGSLNYSIGSGGDLNYPRPDRVEAAFFRQVVGVPGNQVDYPLDVLNSREDYNRIALKSMDSFPACLFYDSGYPLGYIYIWPVPSNQYEIHLSLKATLQSFSSLNDTINLPPEYEEALRVNLAVRLRVKYQMPMDPQLIGLAKVALNVIRNSNAQIPTLEMPRDLMRGGSNYNIFSDRYDG
ncbi:hypothetical protein ATY75_12225 [Rhizobium sp. N122]|uniref:hypothetical protein n=1 Tax=Rhizobium sp. N122 TaxID=1764272 RepID=UPI000B5A8DDC|nr:hypothetical protein [Rhizobium sp. N122]OWV62583.1 hypothetical protein ATY75_12225 [Rhizobium sp. N122]